MGYTLAIPFGMNTWYGFEHDCNWAEAKGFRPLARLVIGGRLVALFSGQDKDWGEWGRIQEQLAEHRRLSREAALQVLAMASVCRSRTPWGY